MARSGSPAAISTRGKRAAVAVDRRGGRRDDARDARVARGEQNVQRSLDVDRRRGERVLHRARHGAERSLVEDDLDALDGRVDALVGAEVALDHLDVVEELGEVLAAAGGEVVEHPHGVAAGEQRANEIRADEPGAARDENLPPAHDSRPRRSIVWQGACHGAMLLHRRSRARAARSPARPGRARARPRRLRRPGSRRPERGASGSGGARAAQPSPDRAREGGADRERAGREPDEAHVGGCLDVRVLDAPAATVGRERCCGHVREPVAGRRRGEGRSSPGARMPASRRPSADGRGRSPSRCMRAPSVGSTSRRSSSWSPCDRGSRCSWQRRPLLSVSAPASITSEQSADGEHTSEGERAPRRPCRAPRTTPPSISASTVAIAPEMTTPITPAAAATDRQRPEAAPAPGRDHRQREPERPCPPAPRSRGSRGTTASGVLRGRCRGCPSAR